MGKLHYEDLGACEICDHCMENRHPWYHCGCDNENFGNIDYPEECDEFEYADDGDDNESEDDDFDPNKTIECPICGNDAVWEGTDYECDQCGWCSSQDDDY